MMTAPSYAKSARLITRERGAQRSAKSARKNLANAHARSVDNPSHAMAAARNAKRNLKWIANVSNMIR